MKPPAGDWVFEYLVYGGDIQTTIPSTTKSRTKQNPNRGNCNMKKPQKLPSEGCAPEVSLPGFKGFSTICKMGTKWMYPLVKPFFFFFWSLMTVGEPGIPHRFWDIKFAWRSLNSFHSRTFRRLESLIKSVKMLAETALNNCKVIFPSRDLRKQVLKF